MTATSLPRISTKPEAEALMAGVRETMDQLASLLADETALLRAGKLKQAGLLQPDKADLARRYLIAVETIKANRLAVKSYCKPDLEFLQSHHEQFAAGLQTNMSVLSTAKAVTEGLVQEIAAMETRAAAPQGYGATGASTSPRAGVSRPIGVARSL
jgi:hypothetical protein